jgi:hypothetical protein
VRFVSFVFLFRDLYVDVFRATLLAFTGGFAEAVAGSFFVVGIRVVAVEQSPIASGNYLVFLDVEEVFGWGHL